MSKAAARTWTINDIKNANKQAGYHFFSPGAMRSFGSRIGKRVYQGPGGVFFLTSEATFDRKGRRFNVRQFFPSRCDVSTVDLDGGSSSFNELTSAATAKRIAQRLAREPAENRLRKAVDAYALCAAGQKLDDSQFIGCEALRKGEGQKIGNHGSVFFVRPHSDGSGFWIDENIQESDISPDYKQQRAIAAAMATYVEFRLEEPVTTDENFVQITELDAFFDACRAHGSKNAELADCRELIRLAGTHHRMMVDLCNGSTLVSTQTVDRVRNDMKAAATRVGAKGVKLGGDPRGVTAKLVWEDGATDDFGQEGWCIPTKG